MNDKNFYLIQDLTLQRLTAIPAFDLPLFAHLLRGSLLNEAKFEIEINSDHAKRKENHCFESMLCVT